MQRQRGGDAERDTYTQTDEDREVKREIQGQTDTETDGTMRQTDR